MTLWITICHRLVARPLPKILLLRATEVLMGWTEPIRSVWPSSTAGLRCLTRLVEPGHGLLSVFSCAGDTVT